MIVVRLSGGLGNQMFQYGIARQYQRNPTEKIVLDTRNLKKAYDNSDDFSNRPFALSIFKGLKAEPANRQLIDTLTGNGLAGKIRRKLFSLQVTNIFQQGMEFVPLSKPESRYIYLGGNFQSEQYFQSLRAELMDEFGFPPLDSRNENIRQAILQSPNALSIHVRRGDYLAAMYNNVYTSVSLDYYRNALSQLTAHQGISRPDIYVFTDDVVWSQENLKYDHLNLTFVTGNDGADSWKDMCLMSCCRHHIIANSSFSWWGAWLAQRKGINMAPVHWFRPGSHTYRIDDIVPAQWSIIDYKPD